MEVSISVIKSAKRIRSTSMRILNKGVVELRAPFHAHSEALISFIASNGEFLAKSLEIPHQVNLPGTLSTGEDLYIFGRHYLLELLPAQNSTATINHEDKVFTVRKRGRTISRKQLYELLSDIIEEYISKRASELEQIMSPKERFKSLRFKLVRSQWGSCSRTGNLTFNRKLIHYPYEVIDYVIVHELAHLQQHNHSKAFWDIVEKEYPDYKDYRKILKKRIYG